MASDPYTYWTALADGELTVETAEQQLSSIQDDLWVAAACTDRVLDDAAVQRRILEIGVSRTSDAVDRSRGAVAFSSSSRNSSEIQIGGPETPKNENTFSDALLIHFRDTPVDAQLCRMRAVLLERLDRLNTYVEICKEAYSPEENVAEEMDEWDDDPWGDSGDAGSSVTTTEARPSVQPPISLSTFILDSLLNTSCCLASMQWFAALQILFRRHKSLWPYRLIVLNNIPEHVHPTKYVDIFGFLPGSEIIASGSNFRTEQDWSENLEVQAVLARVAAAPGNVSIRKDGPCHTVTPEDLTVWFKQRVEQVIASTGLIDIALATVQHGASSGVSGLDELGEELSLLSRLVYDAPQGSEVVDWTLSRWRSMDPAMVIQAYLTNSTPESLPHDIPRLVMPYLFVLESRAERVGKPDPDLPTRLLYDYVLSTPLEMAAAIFEGSKPTLPPAQRLIRDDEYIARLALACLYGSNVLDQWSTMSRIFECLPAWDVPAEDGEDEDAVDTTVNSLGAFVTPSTSRSQCTPADLLFFFKPLPQASLSRALDILDVHLESGEILSRWNAPAPLRWFLQSNSDVSEQKSWANRMVRRAGSAEERLKTLEDWEWLLEDMLKLTVTSDNGLKGAFGLLSEEEIMHIFLSGLLSSGDFDVARSLIRSPKSKFSLNPAQIEEICLSCSREFYDNASSGNYTFGDMKLAYDCLDVPSPSERLLREKGFIEATSRISSFNVTSRPGIPISPIEIRLTNDRLALVSRVLSSNNDAYKHTEVILDLVRKLGFENDVVAEVKALAMLADTALQAEDFLRAYELSERMRDAAVKLRSFNPLGFNNPQVMEANEVCWVSCFQLGRHSEFDDLGKKLSLLGHALELCPPEKLPDVLAAWRRLEKENIEAREERLSSYRAGSATSNKRPGTAPINITSSLRARLQDFHMPSPPLLSTPDAAALASRTFRSVAANFPFSVGHSQASEGGGKGSRFGGSGSEDVSAQATRVLSKGIGWLIGADEEL